MLGIDPGLANTGYGVVVREGSRLAALDGGVIETRAGVAVEQRLAQIAIRIRELLEEHECDAMALEQLYFGQNAHSAFAVGQARGVTMLAAGERGIPCFSYTPQKIKSAVCGHGRAAKDQVGAHGADAAGPARDTGGRPRLRRAGGGGVPRQRHAARGRGRERAAERGCSSMIALVRGEVAIRRIDHVVVLCGGVGYRMAVSSETLRHVPAVGARRRCTPIWSCATTRWRCTAFTPSRSATCS